MTLDFPKHAITFFAIWVVHFQFSPTVFAESNIPAIKLKNKEIMNTPNNDRYFSTLPDNIMPKKELLPNVYLIYYSAIETDPVQVYKGIFDTIGKQKREFTFERIAGLYQKRKPWPLTNEMVQNLAEAISKGNVLKDNNKFHPLKIERDNFKIIATWYSLLVSHDFPTTLSNNKQRESSTDKYRLEINKNEMLLTTESQGSQL